MTTAVITGSTRGIGFGLARELLARGCAVVITGRTREAVDAALDELGRGDEVLGIPCDVTDPASVQRLWDGAVGAFGRVDLWVNNAGTTTTPIPFWELPIEQVHQTVRTNVLGTMHGTMVALRGMKAQSGGGHIFNIEGMGSKGEVQEGVITYGATKAAVGYLDKAVAKELKGSPVRLTSVRPGINITDHLLHDAHVLSPERWRKTRKVMNILGDLPETTTPWLAEQMLQQQGSGHIAWLSNGKVAWRFATAGFRKRDLFAGIDAAKLPTE